jgi:RND family efflux transporter MFP subunit
MLKKKWIWGVLLGLIIIAAVAVNLININKATEVVAAEAKQGTITEQIFTNGKLEPKMMTNLYSPISGVIDEVHIKLGDEVKKGQLLLTLHTNEIKEQLEKEKINLQLTEAERLNAKKQHFDNFKKMKIEDPNAEINELDLTAYDLRIKSSKLSIESLQSKLGNSSLKASEDGVIASLSVSKGQMVPEGSVVITLADLSAYKVKANLNELDAGKVSTGMDAIVTGEAVSGTYHGTVSYLAKMAQSVDPTSKDVSVEMSVDLNEITPELRPGYNMTVELVIPDEPRLLVPIGAVQYSGEQTFVYKIQDDRALKSIVTTGKEGEDQVEITSGVIDGEQIVVEGADVLRDGDKVKLR